MSAPSAQITLSGAPQGFDAQLLLRERARADGPVIFIARDEPRLAAMRAALGFFDPSARVVELPGWDCLPYDRISPNPQISARRMASLAGLASGARGRPSPPPIVLATLAAASQRLPARALLRRSGFSAERGGRIDLDALRAWLLRMGFCQSPTVTEPGDFAIRGGIVDIFSPGQAGPVRLDLFGDVLDGVRRFDPASQRSIEKLDRIELAPASEVQLDADSIRRFRQAYRAEFGAAGADDPLYEAVSAGRKHQGLEHWLPYFHDRLETLFDYLPGAPVLLDDQFEPARAARWQAVLDQYRARVEALEAKDRRDSLYKPCPAELLYLDDGAWTAALAGRRVVALSALPRPPGPGVLDAGGRAGRSFAPERQAEESRLFKALADHIRQKREDRAVVVAAYSVGARDRLAGLLRDEDLPPAAEIADWRAVPEGPGGPYLAVWPLEQGFETPELTVIAETDVLGERLIRPARRRKRAENFLTEAQALSPGELVVHVEHGIGRFRGLETIEALGAPHECLALEYAGGDRLFVPVENIELLSRYGHEEGLLDRLGANAWQARKARLKQRLRAVAERLIRLAAERALRRAPVLVASDHARAEFAARFPWQETEDQLSAIADVEADLASGRPMDRLICGDVGFGKTEVAMRAAFIAAMAGHQVALIAPTTLLARQHYKSFAERFRGFPVELGQLSRFVPAGEAERIRAGLKSGRIDIVIGTHALLAKSVRFQDLGLLIVDEEQRFGVAHKERLKALRSDVHVLTLTATPIPRTLQMGLSGIRDLSLIASAPVDRLAVRTYVSPFDAVTIRQALLREHYRGGQSFYVVARISDIAWVEAFLREQVPEIRFVVAHGQLPPGELDRRMNAFYDGGFDVLLATSIVESGLDIPTANTMIVHRADRFGLAQLYQIRGRVGRAKTRAFAYLTTKPGAPLTPEAEKRLKVLASLDALGAGFTLASQDLDIRGAGNLIGEQQSGRIREVGQALYQQMLEEAIARIRAGELGLPDAPEETWSPQISLGVPVLIPQAYVPDLDVRLGLYRRLSGLTARVEIEGFAAELIDRFGPLPREVSMLLLVMRIKAMCKRAGIARLDGGPRGATIRFHKDRFADPAGLVGFLQAQDGLAKLRDNRLVVRRDWQAPAERIRGAFALARDLARIVARAGDRERQ